MDSSEIVGISMKSSFTSDWPEFFEEWEVFVDWSFDEGVISFSFVPDF